MMEIISFGIANHNLLATLKHVSYHSGWLINCQLAKRYNNNWSRFFSIIAVILVCFFFNGVGWAQSEEPYWGSIGEGFTSENRAEGVDIKWRMFSAPDMQEICRIAGKPARLIAVQDQLTVKVGEIFFLQSLKVVALDSKGRLMKPVPITLDMEEKEENLHMVNLDEYIRIGGGIIILQPGGFRFWIRTLCTDAPSHLPEKGVFIYLKAIR